MKKLLTYFIICISSVVLCGCTEYPGITDSDEELVAEYVAGLLLEHSKTKNSRLMDVEEAMLVLEKEKQEMAETAPEEVIKEETKVEPEEPVEPDTPVIDNTEVTEETIYPINDVMGMELLTVQLNGYEIKDSYPDGSGAFFALDATEGNKLLVTKLTLTNNTDNSVEINMLDKDVSFKMSLDGSGYKFALSTMLLDDLSTYSGSLSAGSSIELVLISEWNEDALVNITNPTLYIKNTELSGIYSIQ